MGAPGYVALAKLALIDPQLMKLTWDVKRQKKTYLSFPKLLSLVESCRTVEARCRRPLQVAEFGVGRGGSATLLAWLANRNGGTLTLFDVFGRIPSPSDKDGEQARERYQVILSKETSEYYGNIPNLLDVIMKELTAVCRRDKIQIVQGRYEDLVKRPADGMCFDLVHIDCDWYESYRPVLAFLESHLQPGAILQSDDYSNWQGSTAAVDEAIWLKGYKRMLVDGALVIDTGIPEQRVRG